MNLAKLLKEYEKIKELNYLATGPKRSMQEQKVFCRI